MNVAFVSNVVYPFVTGGAEKRIHEIGRRLVERGHEVTVYGRHFWDGPPETSHEGMTLRAAGPATELYAQDRRSITEAVGFGARLARPLYRHVDEHDVVVASVFPYFPVFTASAMARTADIPLVTTWHECWREYWREYLGPLGCGGMAVERGVARLSQYPVAVSGTTADRLAAIGPARDAIDVVHNGIDVERVRSTAPAAEGYDVLFAGRLIPEKNLARLLRGFALLDREATLGVAGDGPERDRLRETVNELGVSDRVDFLGHLDAYDDVLAQMRAARVFASPSTREGFGITLVEAMAAGCTVVAADHPRSAASEVIGDAGFAVEPTPKAIKDVIERALDGARPVGDPVSRAERFDWDVVTEDAEAAYRAAIETHED